MQQPRNGSFVAMWAVRIAFLVGEGVVLVMVGDPGDDRTSIAAEPKIASIPRTHGLALKLRWVKWR